MRKGWFSTQASDSGASLPLLGGREQEDTVTGPQRELCGRVALQDLSLWEGDRETLQGKRTGDIYP